MNKNNSNIEIRSLSDSRVRIKVWNKYLRRKICNELKNWLKNQDNIQDSILKPDNGTIILLLTVPLDSETCLNMVKEGLSLVPDKYFVTTLIDDNRFFLYKKEDLHGELRGDIIRAGVTGVFLLQGYVSRYILGIANFINPVVSAIFLIIISYPSLKEAFKDMKEKRHIILFPFLIVTCTLSVVAGETFSAIEIIWTMMLAKLAENFVKKRAMDEIKMLFRPLDKEVSVIIDSKLQKISIGTLKKNDIITVNAGERLPACGTVIDGDGILDESYITGHYMPERCKKDDIVYEGSTLLEGFLKIQVTRLGDETLRKELLKRAGAAMQKRAWSEKQTDKLAINIAWLGFFAFISTLLTTRSFTRSLSVLFAMAFPAEAMVAASLALTAGIVSAAKKGIVIKGGRYLDRLKIIDTVCFDKTGTLTTAIPRVINIIAFDRRISPETILRMASSVEMNSKHPVARAIVLDARNKKINFKKSINFEEYLGQGICAKSPYGNVVLGGIEFMEEYGFNLDTFLDEIRDFKDKTPIFIAKNHRIIGVIILDNILREDAVFLINLLRLEGLKDFYILSGDIRGVKKIADALEINEYRQNFSPGEKARFIDDMVKQGKKVMMVGDGLNDSMAFSRADLSIAMGVTAIDDVIGYADMVLVNNKLSDILKAREISRETEKIISQNCAIAELSSFLSVLLNYFRGLNPLFEGMLRLTANLGIIFNSIRLIK